VGVHFEPRKERRKSRFGEFSSLNTKKKRKRKRAAKKKNRRENSIAGNKIPVEKDQVAAGNKSTRTGKITSSTKLVAKRTKNGNEGMKKKIRKNFVGS